jgi:hypothetical protein
MAGDAAMAAGAMAVEGAAATSPPPCLHAPYPFKRAAPDGWYR